MIVLNAKLESVKNLDLVNSCSGVLDGQLDYLEHLRKVYFVVLIIQTAIKSILIVYSNCIAQQESNQVR